MPELPAHASPVLAPIAQTSAPFYSNWDDDHEDRPSTPLVPGNLISPAFTPPATPGFATPSRLHLAEPKSVPVDTLRDPSAVEPKLVEHLPKVECVVRARIPTTSGAEMFLHLYQNDADNKEHLAIVFGNAIRSRSLDAERPGETEMDRMIRGAYVGRLRPGRVSSRIDDILHRMPSTRLNRSGSSLKKVHNVSDSAEMPPESGPSNSNPSQESSEEETSSELSEAVATYLRAPLVRIHSECYTGEIAWSARCDCGEQLDEAARLMSLPNSTGGVIVYLRQEGRGIGLASKLKAYNLQDLGNDTVEANLLLRHPADARTYGLATAILVDLGLGTDTDGGRGIRLLTNNPEKVRAVEGPNREVRVRERVAMIPLAWRTGGKKGIRSTEIEKYLETKIGRMGHMIHE